MAIATLSKIYSPLFRRVEDIPYHQSKSSYANGSCRKSVFQLSFDLVEEPEVVHPAIIYQGDGTALQGATVGGDDGTLAYNLSQSGRRNQDRRNIELNFVDNFTPMGPLSLYRRLFEGYPQIHPAEESRIGLQTTDSHLNQLLGNNFVS